MKNICLLLSGLLMALSVYAQNPSEEIPQQSDWKTFDIDKALQDANNGDANAQFYVALYYRDVVPDNTKFQHYIEMAATQNHAEALCVIAQQYFIGDYGFPVNEAKALEYARKAASLNNIQAISMMAEAYKYGMNGLSKDDMHAAYWFEKGARLDDAYCQAQLGTMYLKGIGVSKNEKKGLYWLQKSADQKYIDAQCMLIVYYDLTRESDKESENKLMLIGLDFLTNPEISQNSKLILLAKGLVGVELFNRKNYKRGIQLMREGLKSQDELLQFYWEGMDKYAREVLGTTLYALENQ